MKELWLPSVSLAELPAHRLFPVVRESTERVPSGEVATSSTCPGHSAVGPSAAALAQQELQSHPITTARTECWAHFIIYNDGRSGRVSLQVARHDLPNKGGKHYLRNHMDAAMKQCRLA